MFGFLPSPCSTCHEATHSVYRQYFCGLSSALAKDYGSAARFFTNRDGTFFSILAASQMDALPEASFTTCCNPLGKKRELCDRGSHASYAAAVSVCGVAKKLEDDAVDESGIRKQVSSLGSFLMRRQKKKAMAILTENGFPVKEVEQQLSEQETYESNSSGNWRLAASPSARAFGAIFSHAGSLSKRPENQYKNLTPSGEATGRIIYLMDAFEDREADLANGRFNPLQKSKDRDVQFWFEEEFETLVKHFEKVEMGGHILH